jgi:hypothetical protein
MQVGSKNSGSLSQNKPEKQIPSNENKDNAFGAEWVTVKSEPGDKHEFEAAILQNIKQEKNTSETESETETRDSSKGAKKKKKSRRRKERLDNNITQAHTEETDSTPAHSEETGTTQVQPDETDTKERIRRLREKLRAQQEECESLKQSLLNESESTS